MTSRNWTRVTDCLPEEGKVVETISTKGLQQDLKRSGRLWFVPDGSVYVYYEVAFWRDKADP